MELVIHSRSGTVARELKNLCRALPGLDCILSLSEEPPTATPLLLEKTQLFVPTLGNESEGMEIEQTSDSLSLLLRKLLGKKGLERQATLQTTLTLTAPSGHVYEVVSRLEVVLAEDVRGSNHFGFDALFIKYDYDKTFAELPETTKQRISHRPKAFEKLRPKLEGLLPCTTT